MAEMTEAALRQLCREQQLYTTPHLNDTLFAGFQGFVTLGGLERYTGLRALHLESNALDSIEGLPHLPELACMFLQQNSLVSLRGLTNAPALATLNVSNNALSSLAGVEACPRLESLLAAGNRLSSLEAWRPLQSCVKLNSLDLQDNELEDPEGLLTFLQGFPSLGALYLRGNPAVSSIRSYRKTLIAALPALSYLDDRPICEVERLCAEAWARGGLEAERAVRAAHLDAVAGAEQRQFMQLQAVRKEGFRKRRESLGLPPGDTDPFFELNPLPEDDLEDDFQEASDPPELVAAEQRLATMQSREQTEESTAVTEVSDAVPAADGDSDNSRRAEDGRSKGSCAAACCCNAPTPLSNGLSSTASLPRVRDSHHLQVHATGPPAPGTAPAPLLESATGSAGPLQAGAEADDPTRDLGAVTNGGMAPQTAEPESHPVTAIDGEIATGSRELLQGLARLAGYDLSPDDTVPAPGTAVGGLLPEETGSCADSADWGLSKGGLLKHPSGDGAGNGIRDCETSSARNSEVSRSGAERSQPTLISAAHADGRPRTTVLIEEVETVLGGSTAPSGPATCEQITCDASADPAQPTEVEVLVDQAGGAVHESWGMEELD